MAFTHGMNIDEVTTQKDAVDQVEDGTTQSRGDANDMIIEFVESAWWGEDADQYQQDWMDTVDKAYEAATQCLSEDISPELLRNINEQEETSAR